MEIVRHLRTILPPGYRAAPKVHLGSPIEVDVSTYASASRATRDVAGSDPFGTAAMTALDPTLTVEVELSEQDEYEVQIFDTERGRLLVAAIELVSPSNKDRPAAREVFVAKAASLLQQGVCVSLVDLVSVRQSNLYADLLTLLDRDDPALGSDPPPLYAVTLRLRAVSEHRPVLDAWFYPMVIGEPLPALPIWLTADRRLMLALETSYQETCRVLGIS